MSLALVLALAAQAGPAQPAPDLALSCVVIGRDDARARFELDIAGQGEARRFALRAQPGSPWVSGVAAASLGPPRHSVRPGASLAEDLHFVAGGVRYWMRIHLAGNADQRVGPVDLEEDIHGNHGLNREVGRGVCRTRTAAPSQPIATLPALPPIAAAPIGLTSWMPEIHYRTSCALVRPDLGELGFDMKVILGRSGTRLAIDPAPGRPWPVEPVAESGAVLGGLATLRSDPRTSKMAVLVAAGNGPAAKIQFDYLVGGSQIDQAGWVTVRQGEAGLIGAGYCRMDTDRGGEGATGQ